MHPHRVIMRQLMTRRTDNERHRRKNRAISIIDDGSQIHSLLRSTMTLNQSWTGNAASPDWSGSNNPIIYADIRNGVTPLDAVSNVKWSYNGTEITFNSDNISTNAGISGCSRRQPTIACLL